jgi:hypothetical protein
MNATAFQAKDISKTNTCPLRACHTAITACFISRQRLNNGLVLWGHLHHGWESCFYEIEFAISLRDLVWLKPRLSEDLKLAFRRCMCNLDAFVVVSTVATMIMTNNDHGTVFWDGQWSRTTKVQRTGRHFPTWRALSRAEDWRCVPAVCEETSILTQSWKYRIPSNSHTILIQNKCSKKD